MKKPRSSRPKFRYHWQGILLSELWWSLRRWFNWVNILDCPKKFKIEEEIYNIWRKKWLVWYFVTSWFEGQICGNRRVSLSGLRFSKTPLKNPQGIHMNQNPFKKHIFKPIWQHEIQGILISKNLPKIQQSFVWKQDISPLKRKYSSITKSTTIPPWDIQSGHQFKSSSNSRYLQKHHKTLNPIKPYLKI